MKKLIIPVFTTMVAVAVTAGASAQDSKITASANYLFGTYKEEAGEVSLDSKVNGYLGTVDVDKFAGPLGAVISYTGMNLSNFKFIGDNEEVDATDLGIDMSGSIQDTKLFASYSLSSESTMSLKILGGYEFGSLEVDLSSTEIDAKAKGITQYNGFAFGLQGGFGQGNFSLKGTIDYSPNLSFESKEELSGEAEEGSGLVEVGKGTTKRLGYSITASYLINPQLGLEGGYKHENYTIKADGSSIETNSNAGGFFIGAKYSF